MDAGGGHGRQATGGKASPEACESAGGTGTGIKMYHDERLMRLNVVRSEAKRLNERLKGRVRIGISTSLGL